MRPRQYVFFSSNLQFLWISLQNLPSEILIFSETYSNNLPNMLSNCCRVYTGPNFCCPSLLPIQCSGVHGWICCHQNCFTGFVHGLLPCTIQRQKREEVVVRSLSSDCQGSRWFDSAVCRLDQSHQGNRKMYTIPNWYSKVESSCWSSRVSVTRSRNRWYRKYFLYSWPRVGDGHNHQHSLLRLVAGTFSDFRIHHVARSQMSDVMQKSIRIKLTGSVIFMGQWATNISSKYCLV